MKLRKYYEIKYKQICICVFFLILVFILGLVLFRSYAIYVEKKEYDIIEGEIPGFSDIKLAILIDGEKSETIPERGLYATEVICKKTQEDGSFTTTTVGSWDYNAWNLKLDYIENGSRCNVSFTSNLSQEEYDSYINAGVSLRRNTYRGKDITAYYQNGTLYSMIESCSFDDIYVGDYIEGSKFTWLVADLNNYIYTGNPTLKRCHATIIPKGPLTQARMNSTNTTVGGYYGSEMVQKTLTNLLHEYIFPDFGDHVVNYYSLLSNDMISNLINRYGRSTGATNNFAWYERKIDLMSEVNVFGNTIWSSSGFDVGIDNEQYAIFRLRSELIHSLGKEQSGNVFNFWLKNVVDQYAFGFVYSGRDASSLGASNTGGVLPRFLID